jgi:DNA-binding transcriptional LysR family regulator
MDNLSNLRTFIAVATAGSFSKAAMRLGISPAMAGRRIQALEEEFGVKLIERTTRTQRLTETGCRFLDKANRVVEEVEELQEIAHPTDEAISGNIRISGSTTLGVKRLASSIARFANEHPTVTVDITLTDRNVDLISEGYDLAIRVAELRPSSLIAKRIGTYHFVCCAAPAYLARHGKPEHPLDLTKHRCILSLNLIPRDKWHFWDVESRRLAVDVRSNIAIDNGEAMRMAALEGGGIIYAPLVLVQEDLAAGRLVSLFEDWGKHSLPISAVHPSRRFVPKRLTSVINAIATDLRSHPA